MSCQEFDIESIAIDHRPSDEMLKQLSAVSWCKKCAKCLLAYIKLAHHLKDEELKAIFGADLFEEADMIDIMDEMLAFKLTPNRNYALINQIHSLIQQLLPERREKMLMKHYTNECIKQLDEGMCEEYFNMAP